jgi:hypothetical protein
VCQNLLADNFQAGSNDAATDSQVSPSELLVLRNTARKYGAFIFKPLPSRIPGLLVGLELTDAFHTCREPETELDSWWGRGSDHRCKPAPPGPDRTILVLYPIRPTSDC